MSLLEGRYVDIPRIQEEVEDRGILHHLVQECLDIEELLLVLLCESFGKEYSVDDIADGHI